MDRVPHVEGAAAGGAAGAADDGAGAGPRGGAAGQVIGWLGSRDPAAASDWLLVMCRVQYLLRYKEIMRMVREAAQCRQFEERDQQKDEIIGQYYQTWMKPLQSATSATPAVKT